MEGNTCYVGWICFNPINLTIVAINVSFNGTLFIKWSFTVWWSPNHHCPPRAPWFVCKELLLELLKLHVKAYLVLLLVPSQEVLLQKYTETWEQWRAERPRDFEETGWGGGGGGGGKWYSRARMKSDLQWGIAWTPDVAKTKLHICYRVATDYKRYFVTDPCKESRHDKTKIEKILFIGMGNFQEKDQDYTWLIAINWIFFTQICTVTENCKWLLKTC